MTRTDDAVQISWSVPTLVGKMGLKPQAPDYGLFAMAFLNIDYSCHVRPVRDVQKRVVGVGFEQGL